MERHVQRCRPPGGQADRRPGQARHAAVQPAQHRPRQGGKYFRGCTKIFGCVHQVWTLADADGDGLLDEAEFCLAMYLIDHKLSGHDLPASLPPHLRPPGTAAHVMSRHVVMSCHVVMFRAQAVSRAAPAPRGPAASAWVRPDQPQPEHRVLGQRGGGHGVLVRTCGGHRASCVTLQYIYTMHLTRPNRLFIYLPDNDLCIFILPLASSRIVLI